MWVQTDLDPDDALRASDLRAFRGVTIVHMWLDALRQALRLFPALGWGAASGRRSATCM